MQPTDQTYTEVQSGYLCRLYGDAITPHRYDHPPNPLPDHYCPHYADHYGNAALHPVQ